MSKDYKLTCRNGRRIQVRFDGTDKWVSSGCDDMRSAILWAEAQLRKNAKNRDRTLLEFSEGFYTRTDEKSFRARNERKERIYTDHYYRAMDGRLRNYVLPRFGRTMLSKISHLDIDDWFVGITSTGTYKGKVLSPDSRNKVLICISFIMQEAVRLSIIEKNPCDLVESIAERNKPRKPMEEEEMAMMFPKNDQQSIWVWGSLMWTCYFQIMKCTGFRPGEVAGLKIDNYYPELGGVYTSHTMNSQEKSIVQRIKTTEKGKRYKVGLLTEQCLRLLNRYIDSIPENEEFLFKIEGNYIETSTSNKHFVTCAKRIGIDIGDRSQYSLRHTFQTLIAGEVEKGTVEELMGHTKYRQGYDHRDGERKLKQMQQFREKLEQLV
jgi:integrase